MGLQTELREMIAETCSLDITEVVAEANLHDDLGVDSLMLVELAEAIGGRYEIALEADDLVDLALVSELVELVGDRIAPK